MDPDPHSPPARATGRGPGWYRGDLHVHSRASSGGELTPPQLAAEARRLGLDFLATTEHAGAQTHDQWHPLAADDLLVVLGQEVTTHTGHWLALGLPPGRTVAWDYGIRDTAEPSLDGQLATVRGWGGTSVVAHPYAPYPSGTFMYPYEGFDAVEVWNGAWDSDVPWQADNETALAEWGRELAAGVHRGRWRPAVGNSDAHLAGQLGLPHTVVWAAELSTAAILSGIRAGRSWIAESGEVEVSFTVTGHDGRSAGVGERLAAPRDAPVVARVEVRGVPGGVVSFHTERGTVHREPLPEGGAGAVEWGTSAEEAGFVRVEVRHPDGRMAALTNPVLVGG
ncbi:CehA/McbA family metallohydrolase [Streptomyces sp. NPDC087440]|uniref:CehA/McbA family metallohydrolase n=1 Tax=Streptomyces sp. NPDC087440 TaxID=3365790 RepID=UPI00381D67D0